MLRQNEFDKAYDIVWEFTHFIKSISDDNNLTWNLYEELQRNGFGLDSILDVDNMVWMIVLRDTLACYFALGYPQEYRSYRFESNELLW